MIKIDLSNGFSLLCDQYPYQEAIVLLSSLDWVETRVGKSIENYSLGADPCSLGTSLKTKLVQGEFNFLIYKNEVISYSGVYLSNVHEAIGSHRLRNKPNLPNSLFGSYARYVIPHQINRAKSLGAVRYIVSFNQNNFKFYQWLRFGDKRKFKDILFLSQFKFEDKMVKINNVDQWKCWLDL